MESNRNGMSDPPGSRRSSSERVFRVLIVIGTILGVAALGFLTIYAYFTYFVDDEPVGGSGETEPTVEQLITVTTLPPAEQTHTSTHEPSATQAASSPTVDLGATATAACASFAAIFPGTPCPATPILDIAGTATAVCLQFEEQFPGTPCP